MNSETHISQLGNLQIYNKFNNFNLSWICLTLVLLVSLNMYNPYSNSGGFPQQQEKQRGNPQFQGQSQFQGQPQFGQNLQHPQPQHGGFQQQPQQQFNNVNQQQHQQHPQGGNVYPTFINDQAASIATQFAKSQFETSNQYLQQNFGQFLGGNNDIKYYFQVSNSYVIQKIILVLFPYLNKNWNRISAQETGESTQPGGFAPPIYDVNAPDLYIPLMSFVTYILLWAIFQGLKGEFHPELFGLLASQTIGFAILDVSIFKTGLYLLSCSTQSSIWDLISFSGYKYVSIIVLLCWKHVIGNSYYAYYPLVLFLITNLAIFLMRSLKFLVLPSSSSTTSNSVTSKQRKIRIQFLFVYSVIVQGLIILFMSR